MAVFEKLVQDINDAANMTSGGGLVHHEYEFMLDYRPLFKRLTFGEVKMIQGKRTITREKADQVIAKIDEFEKIIDEWDLDEFVGELCFGQYVVPSRGPDFRFFEVYQRSLELGRPLTDEELEEFRIDFTKDFGDDDGENDDVDANIESEANRDAYTGDESSDDDGNQGKPYPDK